jgi:hypothetical protein
MVSIETLWSLDLQTTLILVGFITVEAMGVVQALKNRWIFKKMHPILICFLFCVVASIMQSHWVHQTLSSVFNLVFLSFSVGTIAAQGVLGFIERFPDFLQKLMNSKAGIKEQENPRISE